MHIHESVNIPIPLYKSLQGKYFVGLIAINYLPPETSSEKIIGRVAFGWWEEKIKFC